MTDSVPRLFAVIKTVVEDMHGIAVDGLRRDNARDMQAVLASQLRMAVAAVDCHVGEIKRQLGEAHD